MVCAGAGWGQSTWDTRILARNGQNISDYCTSGTTVVRSTVQGRGICDLICSIVCSCGHLLPRILKHMEAKAALSCRIKDIYQIFKLEGMSCPSAG